MLAPSQTVQDLQRARNLIADPKKWCQGGLTRLIDGRLSHSRDSTRHGVAFCAIGALVVTDTEHSVGHLLDQAALDLFPKLREADGLRPAAMVNDDLGHAAVLRMYDRAIELAMSGNSS